MKYFLAFLLLFGYGFAQKDSFGVTRPAADIADLLVPGTVFDRGFFSGGTVSGGVSYQLDNSLVVDGSYLRPIITLNPLELYSLFSLKGTVSDISNREFGAAIMAGFGLSYITQTLQLAVETRLWNTYSINQHPGFQPEIVLIASMPIETLLGP